MAINLRTCTVQFCTSWMENNSHIDYIISPLVSNLKTLVIVIFKKWWYSHHQVFQENLQKTSLPLSSVQWYGETQPVAPVQPIPPHWPYSGTVPAGVEVEVVGGDDIVGVDVCGAEVVPGGFVCQRWAKRFSFYHNVMARLQNCSSRREVVQELCT